MPCESIDCVVTSPPYWALRAYRTKPQIWDAKEGCRHEWNTERTQRANMSGGYNGILKAKGKENYQEFVNYKDRTTESNFCQKCGAWRGELGLEPTFQLYVKHLCDIFDEIKRVLKKTGTCWVNLGDTYGGSGNSSGHTKETKNCGKKTKEYGATKGNQNLTRGMEKSLLQIPSRFAIEMTNRGWILRNRIIWHKNNCMPSSATDRFTIDYEDLFFFTKSKKYYFEQQFEGLFGKVDNRGNTRISYNIKTKNESHKPSKDAGYFGQNPKGHNKRCVWNINTKPFKEAHFAVFPEALIETPIKAGCPEFVCKKCGNPVFYKKVSVGWIDNPDVKEVKVDNSKPYAVQERNGYVEVRNLPPLKDIKNYLNIARKKKGLAIKEVEEQLQSQAPHHWFNGESYPTKDDWLKIKDLLEFDDTYDFQMTDVKYKYAEKLKSRYETIRVICDCNAGFERGIVLDPFFGSGTTGLVARKQLKNWIGIELNPEYIKIAEKRIKAIPKRLDEFVKKST